MRSRIVWLAIVLLIGFIGICPSYAQDVVNLLRNGGFEDGVLDPWDIYAGNTGANGEVVQELVGAAVPEDPIEGDYCLHIVVPNAGANRWDAGMTHRELDDFETGKKYTLSAFIKSREGTLDIVYKPERAAAPHEGYPEQLFTITDEWEEYSVTTPVFTEDVTPAGIAFHIAAAPGDFWIDNVRFYEGDYVAPPPTTAEERAVAIDPDPSDGATNVPNDTALSWTAGEFAATHDVYLGKIFDDVNDATRANPMDVLVSKNQLPTTHQPHDPLEFGLTYYWRIDEVNVPPDTTVYKGTVWSFRVEPYAYPIENITATASSSAQDQGPANTVNGSGLDASDQHSTTATDMWLSDAAGPQPSWIQYEFDKAYALLEMWVWNSNQLLESVIGIGAKDVTIEYSQDGEVWTTLGDVQFAQATASADYTHNTTVDLGGVFAQYVRLTVNNNWVGLLDQYGLSEVRFFQVPVQADGPLPASGDSGVDLDVTLDWRSGREATLHEVCFSTDKDAVIDGTAFVETVTESSYQPGTLEYGQRYYWKVNEVNEAASTPVREGEIWSFSTIESFVVDDFEGYSADVPIWESWLDGLGFGAPDTPGFNPGNGTGSAVGDDTTSSFTEETIVHGGNQSMPLFYNNSKPGFANYSEIEHTLDQTGDWTKSGVTQLSLWFRGYPGSVGSFVDGPVDTFTMTASGTDIWDNTDEFHFAYKMLTGPGSIVARVQSAENTDPWAKAGVMIRETLDPESAHATAVVTPVQGVSYQRRLFTSGTSTDETTGGISAPHWVKIERSLSGSLTAYHSSNGSTWETLGTPQNIQMSANVYIGLAVTAHDAALTCEAVFSSVTTTGSVSGQWTNQDIGIAANDAEAVYVGIVDTAGNVGVVEHEDPSATQIDTWSQWSVDLAEFADQGVNLADVQKIIFGVGSRTNPAAGGSGTLFVDDIAVGNPLSAETGFANLLANDGFEDGVLEPWDIYAGDTGANGEVVQELVGAAVPEDPIEGDYCLHIVVPNAGANRWDAGLTHRALDVFEAGKKYTLSAFVKCNEGTLDIVFKPERAETPYEGYPEQLFTITDEWAEYSVTTPVFTEDVAPAGIAFHIATTAGEFWIDNVRLYEGDYVPPE